MQTNNLITLYNPAEKNRSNLINEFVVRINSFNTIFNDIKTSSGKIAEQHYLIVGQRGSGKTTLLHRLKYAIEDDGDLRERLIPINLGEEQYHINSLSDLWESLSEILEDYYLFRGLSSKIIEARSRDTDDERECLNILVKALDQRKKKVILFIDNFGDLLRKLNEIEVKSLREILMTYPHIRLIAGTPVTLESVFDYSQPLFEFFKIIELKGLDNDETKTLLLKLASINGVTDRIEKILEDKPERVEILRRLTGGVIRTMVLLFKIFIETDDGSSIRDLQLVLDSVTPLYKHRMDDLPTQQQKIVDIVAKNWDAISVKDITKKSRISSKTISAQLRQLEKNQIISKVNTDSKNHLYHLKERFFNIWYLMRYGRRYDKKRVIWLVRFFETWCDKRELEERVKLHIENLRSEKYDRDSAIFMGEAYVACMTVAREIKEKLIETTADLYPMEFDKNQYNLDDDLIKEAHILMMKEGNIEEALRKLDTVKNLTKSNYGAVVGLAFEADDNERAIKTLKEVEKRGFASARDLYVIGALDETKFINYQEAFEYYKKSEIKGYKKASSGKARIMYERLGQVDEAEKILLTLLENEPNNQEYFHNLGHLYGYFKKDYDKAIHNFQKSIDLGRTGANLCLGALYHYELKDFEKAKEYYLKDERRASYNLGKLYANLKEDYKTAAEYFEKAINDKELDAYYALGWIYENKLNIDSLAVKYYDLAYKEANDKNALHRLAHIYAKNVTTRVEAEKYFKMAIEEGDSNALACLALFYYVNEINKSEAVELINKAKSIFPGDPHVHEASANIMLWDDKIETVFEDLNILLKDEDYVEKELEDITALIVNLISRRLYYPVLKLFQNTEFKLTDIMKPVYFALMNFMKDEFPNETLKMGEEIAETVKEIIDAIKEMEEKNFKNKIKTN